MAAWWKEAFKLQQYFCERLEDREWDRIEGNQRWALEIKVAFALFGETAEGGQLNQLKEPLTNKNYFEKLLECCYSVEQREQIKRICDQIYKTTKSSDILVAFLFVVGDGDNGLFMQPFFRFKRDPSGDVYFLDILCRVYKNWDDYTRNNKLPVGLVLYPHHGSYRLDNNNKVLLQWVYTPATEYKYGIKSDIDKGFGFINKVLAGVGLISMFTPVGGAVAVGATVASAVSGVYGVVKGSSDIHDLRTHGQKISPFTLQGFKSWFPVACSVISLGSGLATKGVAEFAARGKEVNKVCQGIVDGLNGAALFGNGVGIAFNFVTLVDKFDQGELKAKDIKDFTVSCLFFANSAVKFKTAAIIIEEVQNDVISSITSDQSKRQAKSYAKLVRNSGGDGTMEDKARIIKGIRNVESKDDFYRINNRALKQDSSAKLNDKGKFEVGGKAYVDTDKKLQTHVRMNPSTAPIPNNFLYTKNDFENLTGSSWVIEIKNICIEYKKEFISLVNGIKIAMEKLYKCLANLFRKYFRFAKEKSFQRDRIINFIDRSERFAVRNCCKTEDDYIDFTRFLFLYEKMKLKEMENNYQREKNEAKIKMGEKFDELVFARNWGVKDLNDREHSFLKTINDEMEQSLDDLQQKFETYTREVSVLNENGDLKFKSNYHALNEYLHCFVVDGEELSPSEFFSVIRKVVVDEKSTKTPHEENSIISYSDEEVSVDVVNCGEEEFFHSVKFLI